ncbi:recombinase family protein [Rhizobium sp. 16-449-1b]|uniref:recombinase family protein n=1 Tax=Rhizobium sp. 16-449-1b TaxID=2819989 RepID=UPI001ADB8369|nr:recombinase family protein [Rhizobium sp. 16-449-1b]MBO9194850.1 recombinase family protein [Rhizobium sp. 16-449-1b]
MTKNTLIYLRDPRSTTYTACAESQLHYAKAFIKQNGWRLEQICRDQDVGEVVFTAQPGVQALLAEVEVGSLDVILCHTLDRLCSRFAVAERLLHDLDERGIELWAADPGIRIKTRDLIDYYYNDPAKPVGGGCHIAPMPDDLYEIEHLVPLPYGYRYTGAYNADGTYIFGFKVLDQEPAEVVLWIFQMYADGLSPAKIAAILTDEGVPGPGGRKWRGDLIRGDRIRRTGILNDEIYIGRSWVPGRIFANAPALQIVSMDLWIRVKRRQDFAARGPVGSP